MRKILSFIIFLQLCTASCSKAQKKDTDISQNNKYLTSPINFFDKKFITTDFFLTDEAPPIPTLSGGNKDIGIFSINYIGKSEKEENYWSVDNPKGYFENPLNIEELRSNSKAIRKIINRRKSNYYIIANYLPRKHILKFYSDDEFEPKENAFNYFYIYENNKWVFIEKLKTKEFIERSPYKNMILKYQNKEPVLVGIDNEQNKNVFISNIKDKNELGNLIFHKNDEKLEIKEDLLSEITRLPRKEQLKHVTLLNEYIADLLVDIGQKINTPIPFTDREFYKILAYASNYLDPLYIKYRSLNDYDWADRDIAEWTYYLLQDNQLENLEKEMRINNYYNLPNVKNIMKEAAKLRIDSKGEPRED